MDANRQVRGAVVNRYVMIQGLFSLLALPYIQPLSNIPRLGVEYGNFGETMAF